MLGLVKHEFIRLVSGQHYSVAISYLSVIMMLLLSQLIIMFHKMSISCIRTFQ
jgi:hypothetical protein